MLHRAVCFVCGSPGADTRLYTKTRDKEPYFPFLEHHDPPRGSRTPGADGAVDSCRVCYAFLRQQWEAYERTKTPAIKRLYWLKRSDNGHFTGAETRLQGEYIAQVMGFQFNPTPGTYDASGGNYSPPPSAPQSHFDRSTSSVGQMSRNNTLPPREAPSSSAMSAAAPAAMRPTQGVFRHAGMQGSEGVLDLSLPVKPQSKSEGTISGSTKQDRKRERDFPSHGSRKEVSEGPHGEMAYQRHGDIYSSSTRSTSHMSSHHSATVSYPNSNKHTAEVSNIVTCFICAVELPFSEGKLVYSCPQDANGKEPYFPFLESLSPPSGSVPVHKHGATKLCIQCLTSLLHQWDMFVSQEIPVELRQYKLPRKSDRYKYNPAQSSTVPTTNTHFVPKVSSLRQNHPVSEICYLCGQLYPDDNMKILFTRAPNANSHRTMYFPFVRDLPRPQGAKPLDQEGTVLSCRSCYGHLQKQWQMYQAEAVHPVHRTYTLRAAEGSEGPPGTKLDSGGEPSRPVHSESSISQPLNIQIAANSPGPMAAIPAQGLLAIAAAPTVTSTSTTPNYQDVSPVSSTQVTSQMSDGRRLSGETKVGPNVTVPHPLTQMSSIPQKVCFVCGEKSILPNTQVLCSYPSRLDAKAPPGQANPFFPFLANRDPAGGAEGMTEDGTVVACKYCYHLLLAQWKEYETSAMPSDSNRWLRKYSLKEFVCYVCSARTTRKRMRTLPVKPFYFLKEHKCPVGAIVMDSGDSVATCRKCYASLLHQMKEYDRMGLPVEMRKYNWIPATKGSCFDDGEDDTQVRHVIL